MYFQIKEIILWPRNPQFTSRRLTFKLGAVNVISGGSRTGKSAIIPIIDYCLAANSCTIPVSTIRDACGWFGVVVATKQGEKLFARREPGEQKLTDDMFIAEGIPAEIPDRILQKNTTADAVRRTLDELSGLTNLDLDRGGVGGRPSFRDLSAFLFQPQNIVANRDVLFYKADTWEHREKLRKVFPYVLNAITPELLAKQDELDQLLRELKRKERELNAAQDVSARWLAEMRSLLAQARELGLVSATLPAELSRDEMLELLRKVVASTDRSFQGTELTISESVHELLDLEREESKASSELTRLRRRFSEMSKLRESVGDYRQALQIQRDRLRVADWLAGQQRGDAACPICGSNIEPAAETIAELQTALREIENTAGGLREIPAAFDREFEQVRSEIRESTERLRAVRIRRDALDQVSIEARKQQYAASEVQRFLGNLEKGLQFYESLGVDSELAGEIAALRERITSLQVVVDEAGIRRRKKRALEMVSSNAEKLLPNLDMERPNDPLELSTEDLTLKVRGLHRDVYLWEIGSGSNWLSYHIAITLALQQFFRASRTSPGPSFVVFDQPSQVYFPQKVVLRPGETVPEPEWNKDEDVEAVQKAFRVMAEAVAASAGELQILVLDHAPPAVWGEIEHVELAEEWRGTQKLVPLAWLS